MKSQYTKMLLVQLFLIVFFLFNFIIDRFYNTYLYLVELLIIGLVFWKVVGTEKRSDKTKTDLLLLIIIATISYYVFTYFIGFFIGFIYTTYSRRFLGIVRNIILVVAFILLNESIREMIIKKSRYYFSLIISSVFVFTALELVTNVTLMNINTKEDVLRVFLTLVVPIFVKNIFLTFSTYTTDKFNSIIYQLLMMVPNYLVPVFPDFGEYITVTLLTIQPIITMVVALRILYFKREKVQNTKKYMVFKNFQKIFLTFLLLFLVLVVYLISGFGRHITLAIGSASMTGTFSKGDLVFIDKKKAAYEKGDIIAFRQENTVIVHRIIEVISNDDNFYYLTKGDANNGEDVWVLKEEDIIGKYIGKIKWVGWPTVLLSELVHG